ncbi:MAG TPA: nitroreductase/quinone reductase family protein [Candidatus Dormibacteraeota bacterium]|nr:nitroreductase/quinone reductase family protein [Candidatus Dormibacteraeota bacterium]
MSSFSKEVFDAARTEHEVRLTTRGRKTGRPHHVVVWISTDGAHLYIRSGAGLGRDWPQNVLAKPEAELQLGDLKVSVRPKHIEDPGQARSVSELHRAKYGTNVKPSKPSEPLTAGETATFELLPAD